MFIIIGGYEFFDRCPSDCKLLKVYQLSLCFRCPIFNCTGNMPLLAPNKYRSDWAKIWKEWFDNGMEGLPELIL